MEPILNNFIEPHKEMFFAIDGSSIGQSCTSLRISLTIDKRAIPICWLVKKCKKEHLPATMHLDVFTLLHQLLKGFEKGVILGDGEFNHYNVVATFDESKLFWRS